MSARKKQAAPRALAEFAQRIDRAASQLQQAQPGPAKPESDPLRELIGNVCGCLAVTRAALPGEFTPLSAAEAGVHQVAALALHEFLDEAEDIATVDAGKGAAMKRVRDLLMYARNLVACLDAALWHVCTGREGAEGKASLTGGDVAGTCALIEEHLAEALALLRGQAPGAKGGAA